MNSDERVPNLEELEPIEYIHVDNHRWGTHEQWIYKTDDGLLWAEDVELHTTEGIQDRSEPYRVEAKTVTTTVYEKVK